MLCCIAAGIWSKTYVCVEKLLDMVFCWPLIIIGEYANSAIVIRPGLVTVMGLVAIPNATGPAYMGVVSYA
ncbi:Uncharacterised protein [uncultured archaeon]|nr:Uncharacterised protein [uncultured archaeon]